MSRLTSLGLASALAAAPISEASADLRGWRTRQDIEVEVKCRETARDIRGQVEDLLRDLGLSDTNFAKNAPDRVERQAFRTCYDDGMNTQE